LDQILISSHSFNEIWIIDHSTSSAIASGHSGGNSTKGGDILYRWGNPMAYNVGTTTNFFGQHNAQWIESGLPYENQIMVFNNGNGRTGGNYSTIEIVNPPVNGYNYSTSLPYLPTAVSWIYNDGNTNSLYAQNISGAQQLSNGNILFCNGPTGTFKEINMTGDVVWGYINPVSNTGILTQGSAPNLNFVFRCVFYPSNFLGFTSHVLNPISIIENTNSLSNSCILELSLIENTFDETTFNIFPNPTADVLIVQSSGLQEQNIVVELVDATGKTIQTQTIYQGSTICHFNVSTLYSGTYFIKINNGQSTTSYSVVIAE
jgi:hypothetical protein